MGLQVLIVDDNVDFAESAAKILRNWKIDAHFVADAEVALETMASLRPDVVLSDLRMPGLDGLQFARKVRAMKPAKGPLLIAISADCDADTVELSKAAGFDMHLEKSTFLSVIRKLLESRGNAH